MRVGAVTALKEKASDLTNICFEMLLEVLLCKMEIKT
jgi:hypothetical protein